jgi:hypothetical protein
MAGTCNTHGGDVPAVFWSENLEGRDCQGDFVINGRVILK